MNEALIIATESPPTRRCGLKSTEILDLIRENIVTSCAEVWIEINI